MKKCQSKSLMQKISVVIASLMICAEYANAADSPNVAASKAATAWRKIVDDGCNSYALPPAQYATCIEQRASELPPLDPAKREHFGELYDPARYLQCKKDGYRNDMGCDRYALRRIEQPEYRPYPDVPPIKWPEPPIPLVYEQMKKKYLAVTEKNYFEELCKAEAGEFVYRTVEDVEGIYQVRPRATEIDNNRQEDRYVIEDPFGARPTEIRYSPSGYLEHGYSFVETPIRMPWRLEKMSPNTKSILAIQPADAKFIRYESDKTYQYGTRPEYARELKSTYGYVWRGISRKHDRESQIGGGEIAIIELRTNEVLAVKE